MADINKLEQEINKIKNRNQVVEGDKAWETSLARKVVILVLTYIAIGIYMQIVNIERPWLNAIVPAVAFMLSTLTMPFFKNLWLKYFYTKK